MIADTTVMDGVAGIGTTTAGCRAATFAAITPAIMTATTMVGTGGVTGIIARIGMATAGVTTDGAAVIAAGTTAGVVAADVTTVGAAVVADGMTAGAVVVIATVTNFDEQTAGPAAMAGLFHLRLR
jgi:hypothetical protein